MAKSIRRSPITIQKAVRSGKMKKLSYLVERPGAVEFNPPEQTHWNKMLAHHIKLLPVDETGKLIPNDNLGIIKRLFIDKKELATLLSIFKQFSIPKSLHQDLTWCYLNMAVAAADAPASDEWDAHFDKQQLGIRNTIDLLDGLTTEKEEITTIIIKHRPISQGKASTIAMREKTLKLTGKVEVGYLVDVLKEFRQLAITPVLDEFSQSVTKKTPETRLVTGNMGHKNAKKKAQDYYAGQLYDFLRKNLFMSLGDFMHDLKRMKTEALKLNKLYSDRQLFLFIGTCMRQSGLLPPLKKNGDDETTIDLIKKKLGYRLTAGAVRRKKAVAGKSGKKR